MQLPVLKWTWECTQMVGDNKPSGLGSWIVDAILRGVEEHLEGVWGWEEEVCERAPSVKNLPSQATTQ